MEISKTGRKKMGKRMVDRGRLDYAKKMGLLDARIASSAPCEEWHVLPVDFSPGNWDVICQGGRENFEHIGNRRFRVCIENHLKAYSQAKSKHARSSLVTRIVDSIKDCVPEGRRGGFVRKNPDTARWHEVGETVSREKVGHALRDAIKLFNKRKRSCGEDAMPGDINPLGRLPENANSSNEKDNDNVPKSSVVPTSSVVQNDWAASLLCCKQQVPESDNESDGDSVLNEMAKETVMEENPLKPASVASLEFSPPGFASLEYQYMTFFKKLAPSPIVERAPQYPCRWQESCHKETSPILTHVNSTAIRDPSPCLISSMVSQREALNNEFSVAALFGSPRCCLN